MQMIEEYGATVVAAAIGAFVGVAALGLVLYWGEDKGIGIAENIRDGLGG